MIGKKKVELKTQKFIVLFLFLVTFSRRLLLSARSWRLRQLAKRPGGRPVILLWSRDSEDREERGESRSSGRLTSWFSDSMKMCRFLHQMPRYMYIQYTLKHV